MNATQTTVVVGIFAMTKLDHIPVTAEVDTSYTQTGKVAMILTSAPLEHLAVPMFALIRMALTRVHVKQAMLLLSTGRTVKTSTNAATDHINVKICVTTPRAPIPATVEQDFI